MDKAIKKRIEQIARGEAPEGYEKTAFGICPCDWKIVEIKNVAFLSKQKYHPSKNEENPKCVELEHIKSSSGKLNGYTYAKSQNSIKNVFRDGDILFGKLRPYLGKYLHATESGVCSTEIWVIRNLETIDNNFLYQLIKEERFIQSAQNSAFGTKMPRAEWEKVGKTKYAIPKLKTEQARIADILMLWDKAIELKEKLIAEKYKQKQYLMDVLLTGKVRLPGFSDDWERVELKDICEIRRGSTIIKSQIVYGSIPVIAGGKEPAYYHNEANRKANVIAVSASGASAGYVAFYKTPIFASDCSTIDEVKNSDLRFIYYSLCLRQDELYNLQSGGAQPHVYPKQLGKMVINKPSLLEQSAIADILSVSDSEIDALKEELILQRKQRDALMRLLLTGIVRVKYE